MSIVKINNLKKTLSPSGNAVLNGINLSVEQAEIASILGESGCGKTTLLNIIGALTPFDDGELFINEQNISEMTAEDLAILRNRTIGSIFQNYNLLQNRTCLENVVLPLLITGNNPDYEKTGMESLDKVGLINFANKFPLELSGGQCQRTAIARALINRPKIILADEPTSNLDDKTSADIIDLLKKTNKTYNTTIIIATHNQDVLNISDKVYRLESGILIPQTK